jgi:hypothetical protein
MGLEVARHEEVGLAEHTESPKHQRNQHAPDPAIAILEGMKRREFNMCERCAYKWPRRARVDELHQGRHRWFKLLGRNGDVIDFPAALVPDIVLRDLVAAGPFNRAATDAEQLLMRGTD